MDLALGRREIASILFKNFRLLLILFVAIFVLVIAGSFVLTEKFKADTLVLVQSGREFEVPTEKGGMTPTGVPQITKQEVINSEVEILSSHDLTGAVIREIGLAKVYPKLAENGWLVDMHIMDPKSDEARMSSAIRKFDKDYKVEPVTMSNIIELKYWNPDREVAIQVLQKLTQIYQQKHAKIFGDKGSGVFGQQTSNYEAQLESVTQKITALKNSQHLSDINYEREQLIQDRADVESKLRDLKTQSIEAHRTLEFYRDQLKSMPELVIMNQNSADAVETAKARLLDMSTQLLQLKQRFADGNADAGAAIQDVQNQMAQIKAFIADPTVNQARDFGRNLTYDDARMKLQTAEAAVPAVDQKIAFETAEDAKILARLQALDDGEASLEVMNREQDTLRELVHNFRDRYEEARTSADMDKQNVISVSVVHPPDADDRPDKPNRLLFVAVGFVGGLMAVAVAVVYLLIFRVSIITTESLERTLGVRVLGAIPDVA
jgi:uncharacterized protein involved in exopolysaccharide biosynthesis